MKSTKNRAISIMICLLMLAQIVPSSWSSVPVFAYSPEPEEMANTKNYIDLPIDPFHVLSYVAAKDATCTELGNIEYWYCADCGQAWLDEACTLNTNLLSVVLPMVDHTYDNDYDVDCNECGFVREVPDEPAEIAYGDANGDGIVDIVDEALLAQYNSGWDVTLDEVAADANGDGIVDIVDEALLAQYNAGWDVKLGK